MSTPTPVDVDDPYYSSIARVAQDLNMDALDHGNQALVASWLAAATDLVTQHCGRSFLSIDETRLYRSPLRLPYLCLGDVQTLTAVRVNRGAQNADRSAWPALDTEEWMLEGAVFPGEPHWRLIPIDPSFRWPRPPAGRRRHLVPNVLAEGTFNWGAVPAAVEESTRLLSTRYGVRHKDSIGILTIDAVRYDPDVSMLLAPYEFRDQAGKPTWTVAP